MSETTPVLGLPLTAAGQAQKHVTVNEALLALDAVVQLSVLERGRNDPPVAPANGERYIVGVAPTGVFAGHADAVAHFDAGVWSFLAPGVGWCAYVAAENALLAFNGTAWAGISPSGGITELQNLEKLGLGATADGINPLSVKLNNALFTALPAPGGSGDLRFKLNKDAPANSVSQLYQTGYSGRAETGLMGDDQFAIKVSADGTTWRQALVIDPATGIVTAPYGVAGAGGGASDITAPVNIGVSATATGGALTVSLTNAAGSAPSGGSPCILPFRAATAGAGTTATRTVSAATTLLISSGSTLGVPAANAPFALWIVAFDDGGTVRLAAINCRAGRSIHPLGRASPLASTLAEGGAGGADSAQVFYSDVALSAKAYCILGRLEWSGGLTTPGTWVAPDRIEPWHPAMALPGTSVQMVATEKTDTFTSTTAATWTDIAGLSATITPTSAANFVRVSAVANSVVGASNVGMIRLCRDASAITVGDAASARGRATMGGIRTSDALTLQAGAVLAHDTPGTTSSTVYKLQFYLQGDVFYLNRSQLDPDNANAPRTASEIAVWEIQT